MTPTAYPWNSHSEYALAFDRNRPVRVLMVPALLDEAHRMRRLCVDVMRRLDASGVDCFLPDLPGTNESDAILASLALSDWSAAMAQAATHFRASHVLAFRGGGLIAPQLPGWQLGRVKGASLLRTLLRARVLTSREAGREESGEDLLIEAQEHGIELAGYRLAPAFVQQLQAALPGDVLSEIDQDMLGGSPLWLRAEPDGDATQADALAAYLVLATTQ